MATFTQIKIHGNPCTLIFTGSHYYLHSSFYGILGQATRDYDKEGISPMTGLHTSHFTLEVGNHHYSWPSSMIATAFRKAITKEEQRYVKKQVSYEVKDMDCANKTLDIKMA